MVYVTHYSYNRSTWYQVLRAIFLYRNSLIYIGSGELYLIAEFIGYDGKRLCIQALVHGYKDTQGHTSSDDFVHRDIHHCRKLIYRNKFSYP